MSDLTDNLSELLSEVPKEEPGRTEAFETKLITYDVGPCPDALDRIMAEDRWEGISDDRLNDFMKWAAQPEKVRPVFEKWVRDSENPRYVMLYAPRWAAMKAFYNHMLERALDAQR